MIRRVLGPGSSPVSPSMRTCRMPGGMRKGIAGSYLMDTYFYDGVREKRGCHPRDIVEAIADAARYQGRERTLTAATIDEACKHYFV